MANPYYGTGNEPMKFSPQQLQMLKNMGMSPNAPTAQNVTSSPGVPNIQAQPGTPPYSYDPSSGLPYGVVPGPAMHQAPLSDVPSMAAAQQSSPGATSPAQTPPTTDPQQVQQWNPLAINMFYATAIAPILKQLGAQFQGDDQSLMDLMNNTPGQQYLTPQQKALTDKMGAQIGLENQNISQDLLGAAVTAPVIDTLSNQMSTLSQRALQAYTEALRQGQNSTLAGIFPTGTPSPTSTNTGTLTAADIQAMVNNMTQPTG